MSQNKEQSSLQKQIEEALVKHIASGSPYKGKEYNNGDYIPANAIPEAAKAIEVICLKFALTVVESIECGADGYRLKKNIFEQLDQLQATNP